MTKILDGRIVRDKIANNLKSEISNLKSKPKLVIVQVGNLAESNTYIRQKILFGQKIGAIVEHQKFEEDISQETLISKLLSLNSNSSTHGIIVQLPIPKHLDADKLTDKIVFWKDVDGLSAINVKHLLESKNIGTIPATTKGIILLLNHYKIPIKSKNVVIIGRSSLVGKPTALALLNRDATVTVCHSETKNMSQITKGADILIVAVGKPKLVTKNHVSPRQVVIDVGINVIEQRPSFVKTSKGKPETEISGRKLVGDVKFSEVSKIVSAISPVPGGIGPMTVASLFQNLLEAHKRQTVDTSI